MNDGESSFEVLQSPEGRQKVENIFLKSQERPFFGEIKSKINHQTIINEQKIATDNNGKDCHFDAPFNRSSTIEDRDGPGEVNQFEAVASEEGPSLLAPNSVHQSRLADDCANEPNFDGSELSKADNIVPQPHKSSILLQDDGNT